MKWLAFLFLLLLGTTAFFTLRKTPDFSMNSDTSTTPPSSSSSETMAPAAQKTTLDNGLTLIVVEDSSAPVVSVQAWCQTGSIHEGRWLGAGLSHILEHMLFKGTQRRGVAAIAEEVQAIGGHMNAYTSYDRTVYHIDAPAQGWKTCTNVLADAMFHSTLPEAEYAKEQEVIRREFAMGFDNPQRMAWHLFFETAYSAHPYRYPVIGLLDIYNRLTRQDVFDYYKSRYVPNNMTFIVVGKVSFAEVRDYLQELVKDTPRQPLPDVFIPKEPAQIGARQNHREFNTQISHQLVGWHIPPLTHHDTYALDTLALILGQGRSSRLNLEVLEKQKLVHSISASAYTPAEAGMFYIYSTGDSQKREQASTAILAEVERIKNNGITQSELDKARKQLRSMHLTQMETMSGMAADIGSSWFVARDLSFSQQYLARIESLVPDQIRDAARRYLTRDNMTTVSLNPKGSLAQNTAPAAAIETTPIKVMETSNGLRVVHRRNPRLPIVSLHAVWMSGVLFETAADAGIGQLVSQTLVKGTVTRSAETLAKELEDIGGNIASSSGNNSTSVAVDVLSQDSEKGFEILADVILHPAFATEETAREKELQLAALKEELDQPMAVCRNLLRRQLYGPTHPYALNPLGSPESLSALSAAQLKEHHAKFATAPNTVLAVFGDISEDDALRLAEKYFSALPATAAPATPKAPDFLRTSLQRFEEAADKAQAVIQIGFPGVSIESPDRFALALIQEAMSDMASRLFIRIREQQGLAYFVGAQQRIGVLPGHFVFYAGTSPDKADKVVTDLASEIQKLREEGLTDKELSRARAKLVSEQLMQQQSNSDYAFSCALDELVGIGATTHLSYPDRYAGITLQEIKEASKKYFAREGGTVAVVKPHPTQK